MKADDVLSNELTLRWDNGLRSLLVIHPSLPDPLIQIRSSTLEQMTWQEAAKFIGERLVLLIPSLREMYIDPGTGMLPEDRAT